MLHPCICGLQLRGGATRPHATRELGVALANPMHVACTGVECDRRISAVQWSLSLLVYWIGAQDWQEAKSPHH